MKDRGSFFLIFIIVLLLIREYVPFVASRMTLTVSVSLIILAYAALTLELGVKSYIKYAAMFAIPIFDTLASVVSIGEDSFLMSAYGLIQIFSFALVGEYLKRKGSDKSTKYLYLVLLLIFAITTITTYLGNLVMPGASRNMATGLKDDRDLMAVYTNLNIGGFAFVYTLVLIFPFLFYVLRFYADRLYKKILLIVVLVFAFLVIYTTEYSTAIIGMILCISVFFLPRRLTQRNMIFVTSFILVGGIVLSNILPSIFKFASNASESYNVSIRMNELGDMLNGTSTSGDVQGRFTLWRQSWDNFIHHPLFGTGTLGGGHSFLLDTLSKYGLIGLMLVYFQYRATYRWFVKPYLKTDMCTLFMFVYMLNTVFSIVNTYFYYNIFLLFIPLFIAYHSQKNISDIKA